MPDVQRWFRASTAGCSRGLCPSRVLRRRPGPGFRPTSPRALLSTGTRPAPTAPQGFTQPSPGLVRISAASRKRRTGRPSEGFCTGTIPRHSSEDHPRYVFTARRDVRYRRPDRRALGGNPRPTGAAGIAFRCQASATSSSHCEYTSVSGRRQQNTVSDKVVTGCQSRLAANRSGASIHAGRSSDFSDPVTRPRNFFSNSPVTHRERTNGGADRPMASGDGWI